MTCENCYHNDACNAWIKRGEILYSDYIYSTKCCPFFKDKSQIVELPCKVGETVYSFCSDFGVVLPYIVENVGIGYMGKDRENYIFFEANCHDEGTDEFLDEIDFDLEDIGKTVFLTREKAEEALRKEREK